MMTIVTVLDKALGAYSRPMCVPSVGIAVRSFTDEVNRQDSNNEMYKHPEDFVLYGIGEFDEETGVINAYQAPVKLESAEYLAKRRDENVSQ